jgi:hypothetical protein
MSIAANFKVLNMQLDIQLSKKITKLIPLMSSKFTKSKVPSEFDLLWNESC